jgi:hypothetical protein
MAGDLDAGNNKIKNVEDPSGATIATEVGDVGFNDGRYGRLGSANRWAAAQTMAAIITAESGISLLNSETGKQKIIDMDMPDNDYDGANKKFVDDSIAALPITPFQESVNRVRVMGGGTQQAGKVYNNIKDATNYFSAPGVNNQCQARIEGTGSGTGFLTAAVGSLRDYVNLKAAGRHVQVIVSDGEANSKIVIFENMTLFFGAGAYGDRSFSYQKFINCRIFAFKNITFNNCELINCELIFASSFQALLSNSTLAFNSVFNTEPDITRLTDGKVLGCSSIFTFTMPADPTIV